MIFPCISWERSSFIFSPKKKYHVFGEKISYFQIILERSYSIVILLEIPTFVNVCRRYHISMKFLFLFLFFFFIYLFFWERPSFIFRLKNKIIFSGKQNLIFTDNTRKIIFPCDCFFGKTFFPEHLEKENMTVRAVFIKMIIKSY